MEGKIQVFVVHGGTTFETKGDYLCYLNNRNISVEERVRWNDSYLKEELGNDFEVINPCMPLMENAKYEVWKIHFERHFLELNDNIILIGKSLGGTFLAKYLSENKFPKKILSVYLVAPPYDNSLPGEDLAGGFELGEDLSLIEKNCNNLNLFFSKDDFTVPLVHSEKYKEKLGNASIIIYESKNGHFKISEFPEIVEMIKKDAESI